jgi:hypothetical protein
MKKTLQLSLAFFAVLIFASFSNAQEKGAISAEKQKLIAEMIVLTKADQQITEITDTILLSLDASLPGMIERMVDGTQGLTEAEKDTMRLELGQRIKSFNEKFRKRLPEVIDYSQYIKETMYPIYDKFFTEKELSELVAFYKTETGQKLIDSTPQLFADSMEMARKLLLPKIEKLAEEVIEEEFKTIKQPPPTAPKDGTR